MLWALGWRTPTGVPASPLPAKTNRPRSTPMTAARTSVATSGRTDRRSRRGPAGWAPPTAATASALRANAVVGVVVPLPGRGLGGEGGQERLVVGVDAVAQQVVGRLVELRRERGRPRQGSQLDVGDVVGQAPAVGEPGRVTAEHPEG